MKFLGTSVETVGRRFGLRMQMLGERREGEACPLKGKAYFRGDRTVAVSERVRETLTLDSSLVDWRYRVF